jgi:hypothetical protein
VLAAGRAHAEGFGATAEPGFSHTETEVTDQAGNTTEETTDLLTQRYRLSFDRAFTDSIGASAGATLLDERGWRLTNGVRSHTRGGAVTFFGRLSLGTPVLSAGIGADRREQRALAVSTSSSITESYTAYASWRPANFPELDLRLGHVNTFDDERRAQDTTTDSASFSARYGAQRYDVRYLLSWSRSDDHLRDFRATGIDQTVLGSRTDSLFGGRTATYVSATLQNRTSLTEAGGAGGTVTRQQLPVAGLSAVETFPATSENVALTPNPLVTDGNVTASGSVNVGAGLSAGGDRDARAVGAQFADVVTAVNTIYVWFDDALTPEVGQALASTVQVWESDDNQLWTPVAISGPPLVSRFENRIEITVSQTQARYLKVTLRPLPVGITTDLAYRDVFVTEVQFLLVLPAALVPRRQSAFALSANGFARTTVLRKPDLAHDLSLQVARLSGTERISYSVVNGVSLAHNLTKTLATSARGSRQDQDVGVGHEGLWQWSASLIGRPLQTAYWTLTYSGSATDDEEYANSLSALGRADWYPGISSQGSAGLSFVAQPERTATTFQTSGTTSLTPNTWLTLTAGGLYSRSFATSIDVGNVFTQFARVDASAAFTPAPALSAAGTISRVLIGARPTTLGTVQVNYFPLRGDVQLAVAYSNTLDTAAEATTELLTPSLRWNIRRGVSLTSSYTFLENVAPAQTLVSRAFLTTLLISL